MAKAIKTIPARNIDQYIAGFPADIQKKLQQLRIIIQKAAPEAEEAIKYGIPTFTLNGNLISFGGWKNHIGFYPAPRQDVAFKKELSEYEGNKSTVQFPYDKPLPIGLITRMVKFRKKKM